MKAEHKAESQKSQTDSVHCFIATDKFHVVPIYDVSSASILRSVRTEALTDRENINEQTLQNIIASRLGFKGGFGGFRAECQRLQDFKRDNNLVRKTDLVSSIWGTFVHPLTHRQIADRLFVSGMEMPKRIFTGYGIDWDAIIRRNHLKRPASEAAPIESGAEAVADWLHASRFSVRYFFNLLGDLPVAYSESPENEKPVFVEYIFRPHYDPAAEKLDKERCRKGAEALRWWMCGADRGWLNVCPFNENLVYLSTGNGEYDFVVRDQRDRAFEHNIYAPYLKNADIPKSDDSYHFQRWLYFEYSGWLEKESYEAESAFYKDGGDSTNYPGLDQVLRLHFIRKNVYRVPAAVAKSSDIMAKEGFFETECDGRKLWVSNPITIRQFKDFMQENQEYAAYRRKAKNVDDWECVNSESDDSLPASVTWYDACAYAAWVSKTRHIPVRLPAWPEYRELVRPAYTPLQGDDAREAMFAGKDWNLLAWRTPDGRYLGRASRLESDRTLHLHYVEGKQVWRGLETGIRFLVSIQFGEWLTGFKGCAVNTATLSAMTFPGVSPERDPFCAHSTGRYKTMKIGFRLCCPAV